MRRLALMLCLMVLLGVLLVGAPPALACSGGGGLMWDAALARSIEDFHRGAPPTLVVGHYVEVDATNTNGIFRVQQYLLGYGPEHITIETLAPTRRTPLALARHERRYCVGDLPLVLPTGVLVYAVDRGEDGVYRPRFGRVFSLRPEGRLATAEAVAHHRHQPTLSTVVARVLQQTGRTPKPPDAAAPYPRTTPIRLTLEGGDDYLLPVDTTTLVPLPATKSSQHSQGFCDAPCSLWTPSGLDNVMVYLPTFVTEVRDLRVHFTTSGVIGQRVAASPNSELIALWTRDDIQVFAFWNPALGFAAYRYGGFVWGDTRAKISSVPDPGSLAYPVAWSQEGATLAFSTDDGLWLWDVLTPHAQPRLVAHTEAYGGVPHARSFSPRGRYVHVHVNGRRATLELSSGQRLPDGIISPNDRILLAYDTAATEPTPFAIMFLAQRLTLKSEEMGRWGDTREVLLRQARWTSDTQFLVNVAVTYNLYWRPRGYDRARSCMHYSYSPSLTPYTTSQLWLIDVTSLTDHWSPFADAGVVARSGVPTRSFDVAFGPGLLQVAVNGRGLTLNEQTLPLYDVLPASITEAVWLPSSFTYAEDQFAFPSGPFDRWPDCDI